MQEELDRNVQTEKTRTDKPSIREETKAASTQTPTPEKQIFKIKKMATKKGPRTKKVRTESEKEEEEKEKEEEAQVEVENINRKKNQLNQNRKAFKRKTH